MGLSYRDLEPGQGGARPPMRDYQGSSGWRRVVGDMLRRGTQSRDAEARLPKARVMRFLQGHVFKVRAPEDTARDSVGAPLWVTSMPLPRSPCLVALSTPCLRDGGTPSSSEQPQHTNVMS